MPTLCDYSDSHLDDHFESESANVADSMHMFKNISVG